MSAFSEFLLDAPLYRDRRDAGRQLADALPADMYRDALVLGLARGGVEVAAEIAAALDAPLDTVAVRKVGHPHHREFALGAVTAGGGTYLRSTDGLTKEQIDAALTEARREADALHRRLHERHRPLVCAGKRVLLVDDGLATGATMIAAARWAKTAGAERVAAAVPVAARQSVEDVLRELDRLHCPHVRTDLVAVSLWYADFPPLLDEDVLTLLDDPRARTGEETTVS